MQSSLFEPENLPQLPAPSFLEHWVLETPLPLALALLLLGIICFGSLRHSKHAKSIGLPTLAAGLVLGIVVYLVGQLITTDYEHLKARSDQLVIAAANGDQQSLQSLLHQDVRVQTLFVTQSGSERIIALAQTRAAPIIESVSVRDVRAGLFGQQVARTQVKIRIQGDIIPPMSWWMLDWTRPSIDSDEWVVTHIEPIWIQGIKNPAGLN